MIVKREHAFHVRRQLGEEPPRNQKGRQAREVVKDPVRVNISTITLEQVMQQSDFITLHVPGGDLITTKEIDTMKKGVILVNASRGGLIDERRLIDGLNSGKISHA